jgi:hypothetical protein
LPNSTTDNSPYKGSLPPVRPSYPPPPSLRLQVPHDGPVAMFSHLVDALDIKDYRTAAAIRSEFYRKLGWSILPPPTPPYGGRRS